MRTSLCLACWLIGTSTMAVAPLVRHKSPVPTAEAEWFAQSLYDIVDQVSRLYIRADQPDAPDAVSENELCEAALEGLYEAAGLPIPGSLAARVRSAQQPVELRALIRSTRLALGNREVLRYSGALRVAMLAMTRALDDASTVVPGQDVARSGYNEVNQGLGLEVSLDGRPVTIRTVLPGGPAQRAGLSPGDRILRINGLDPESAARAIAGRVVLTVQRGSAGEQRTVALDARTFRPETVLGVARNSDNVWEYWVDRESRIAHVRIASLAQGTADELAAALGQLRECGLSALVLDLRWCPGGVPDQIAAVVRLFLSKGVIMVLKDHDELRTARATEPAPFADLPMVVLVNHETTGGAEFIAAALQDNKRALVAGERTRGKATLQRLIPLPVENSYLKVTSGLLVRPSGKNLQRLANSKLWEDWGVQPSTGLEFRLSAELARALKEQWLRQTLRPGGAREALALDDAASDPQRQAAVRALREKLKRREAAPTRAAALP